MSGAVESWSGVALVVLSLGVVVAMAIVMARIEARAQGFTRRGVR